LPLPPDRLFISAGYGCALLRIEHDKAWNVTEVWKNKNLKTQFTNAVVRDGFAYGLDDGILVCLDLTYTPGYRSASRLDTRQATVRLLTSLSRNQEAAH
jgi:hypothetical protein